MAGAVAGFFSFSLNIPPAWKTVNENSINRSINRTGLWQGYACHQLHQYSSESKDRIKDCSVFLPELCEVVGASSICARVLELLTVVEIAAGCSPPSESTYRKTASSLCWEHFRVSRWLLSCPTMYKKIAACSEVLLTVDTAHRERGNFRQSYAKPLIFGDD